MRTKILATSALAAGLLCPAAAHAQQASEGDAPQPAQQCLEDLTALRQQMNETGYWLSGYRGGAAWGGYGVAPAAGAVADPQAPAAPASGTAADPAATQGQGPWAGMAWTRSPSYEIRTLYSAANVLAQRGDEEACQTVLNEAQEVHDQYVEDLREAGVEPGTITSWRQEQILAAQPISELERNVPIGNVTGTDVRNAEDEHLGSVETVVLDPQTGSVQYAIIARGGLLGIGDEEVAVPWDILQATPGLNTIVLNVDEQTLENAPEVDPETFGREAARAEEVDRYWEQHASR